jgi:hypothetical protein
MKTLRRWNWTVRGDRNQGTIESLHAYAVSYGKSLGVDVEHKRRPVPDDGKLLYPWTPQPVGLGVVEGKCGQ